jgi:hypothetical protein
MGKQREVVCEHRNVFKKPGAIKKRAGEVRRRGSTLKQGRGFGCTYAQREKVRGLPCVGCGKGASEYRAIDPAHLWPKGMGGCDDPLCVIPLCRDIGGGCHRLFDLGELDLLPKLIARKYFPELAHATTAHELGPLSLLERTTGITWQPVPVLDPSRQQEEAAAAVSVRSSE